MTRTVSARHFLMCRPTYFAVEYSINAWMDLAVDVDREIAITQWETLRDEYLGLGHRVSLIDPIEGLPDMVYAANGALVVGGRVYGAKFACREREAEGPAHLRWFREHGYGDIREPEHTNEGEGDFAALETEILAGTGYRTEPGAHAEVQEYLGLRVVTLELVDPRFYHLDTALFPLDGRNVCYYPEAFSAASRQVLEERFPEALTASAADADVLGLNAVSDGRNVVLDIEAEDLCGTLARHGYRPVPVDLSELRKAGGGPKCCTLELRV